MAGPSTMLSLKSLYSSSMSKLKRCKPCSFKNDISNLKARSITCWHQNCVIFPGFPGMVPHPDYCKSLLTSLVAHQAGAYPGFRSMKRLGVFLLPPGWDASPSQGYPQQ